MDNIQLPNDQPFSVSGLSAAIKRSLEQNFDHVRVRGELAKVTLHRSGHLYADIKDADAVINMVCWKTIVPRLGLQPAEGMEVICTGKLTTYAPRSGYQLVITSMELAGVGAMLKMLEERRRKLAAEGLFDESRKKPLPFLQQKIGFITSPTGAVIRDMMHRLRDRFPLPCVLWPANMQGEQAVSDVLAALAGFNGLPIGHELRPDVIVIARGGGSLEDLWPFHDEALVRAVAASQIPVISAIGHETDTTLLDYVADKRAPTPTAAIEILVPQRDALLWQVQDMHTKSQRGMSQILRQARTQLALLTSNLRDPQRVWADKMQRLDMLGLQLQHIGQRRQQRLNGQLALLGQRLVPPRQVLAFKAQQANNLLARLRIDLQPRHVQLQQAAGLLESYSHHNVLKRGFALVQTPQGELVTSATQAQAQTQLQLQFADGVVPVTLPQN